MKLRSKTPATFRMAFHGPWAGRQADQIAMASMEERSALRAQWAHTHAMSMTDVREDADGTLAVQVLYTRRGRGVSTRVHLHRDMAMWCGCREWFIHRGELTCKHCWFVLQQCLKVSSPGWCCRWCCRWWGCRSARCVQFLDAGRYKRLELHDVCPICLDTCVGSPWHMCPSCEAPFHVACIRTWMARRHSCPKCRARVMMPTDGHVQSLVPAATPPSPGDSVTLGSTDSDTDSDTDSGDVHMFVDLDSDSSSSVTISSDSISEADV